MEPVFLVTLTVLNAVEMLILALNVSLDSQLIPLLILAFLQTNVLTVNNLSMEDASTFVIMDSIIWKEHAYMELVQIHRTMALFPIHMEDASETQQKLQLYLAAALLELFH
jgi:Na+/H+ antiporter NhaA